MEFGLFSPAIRSHPITLKIDFSIIRSSHFYGIASSRFLQSTMLLCEPPATSTTTLSWLADTYIRSSKMRFDWAWTKLAHLTCRISFKRSKSRNACFQSSDLHSCLNSESTPLWLVRQGDHAGSIFFPLCWKAAALSPVLCLLLSETKAQSLVSHILHVLSCFLFESFSSILIQILTHSLTSLLPCVCWCVRS